MKDNYDRNRMGTAAISLKSKGFSTEGILRRDSCMVLEHCIGFLKGENLKLFIKDNG